MKYTRARVKVNNKIKEKGGKDMKYQELISQMTLEEKASLMSGLDNWHTKPVKRLGIPSMMMADGPHGLRKEKESKHIAGFKPSVPATCYPTASGVANTWDTELAEKMGEQLGQEAAAEGVSMLLGPGMNIKRSPLCGRNFEYFSEDPYLAGKIASAMIRGIQKNGVSACAKHFAANSQELYRMTNDSVLDERTLREIYLPAFEMSVKEGGVRCIMTSYNLINGVYASENPHLLKDILHEDWGYKGMLVTDWGADNDRVEAVKAGCHLEMPTAHGETDREIVEAVNNGRLDEAVLDELVDELLDMVFAAQAPVKDAPAVDFDAHHSFAVKVAEETAVLLKNEDAVLPLSAGTKVAVIGDFARTPRYQGAGSALVNPTRLDNGLETLGNSEVMVCGWEQGFIRKGGNSRKLIRRACRLAKKAEVVLLWLGLDESSESEGTDRADLSFPQNQIDLFNAVKKVNPNVVVILTSGSPVELDWADDAKAILHGYLGGQAGAAGVANIITGRANPSGKLAETMPVKLEDTPCAAYYPGREATSEYREGIYVGYRYYDTANVPVKYPFGYGLSYTTFEYSDIVCDENKVTFTITNTGETAGAEVAQVYVSAKTGGVFRASKELKGFARVQLEPGESKTVAVELDDRAFSYWNAEKNGWVVESGSYEILVGASSRDIRLSAVIEKTGEEAPNPYESELFEPYRSADIKNVPDESFAALIGREIPPAEWDRNAPLNMNSTLAQNGYVNSPLARIIYSLVNGRMERLAKRGKKEEANGMMFIACLPYRCISRMSGIVSEGQVRALLMMINREKGGLRAWRKASRERKKLIRAEKRAAKKAKDE